MTEEFTKKNFKDTSRYTSVPTPEDIFTNYFN